MKKISAVIITKNEEKNIGRCLDSLVGVADEIIVVDSYSTDRTKEICESYELAIVKEYAFVDYSASKNFGNALAKSDYILSIDADEVLSEELRKSILRVKTGSVTTTVFDFNRLTNYCGKWIKHCGWYPDRKPRIWENGSAKWVGKVHEELVFSDKNITTLKGDLLHYSYPTISSHSRKVSQFTDLAAEKAFKKGRKVSVLKLIIAPPMEFFKKFILKRGFLDGYEGFVISSLSAYAKFFKYAKIIDLQREKNNTL